MLDEILPRMGTHRDNVVRAAPGIPLIKPGPQRGKAPALAPGCPRRRISRVNGIVQGQNPWTCALPGQAEVKGRVEQINMVGGALSRQPTLLPGEIAHRPGDANLITPFGKPGQVALMQRMIRIEEQLHSQGRQFGQQIDGVAVPAAEVGIAQEPGVITYTKQERASLTHVGQE